MSSWLSFLFGGKKIEPPKSPDHVPGDEVTVLRFADQQYPCSYDFTTVVAGVLDPDVLHKALNVVYQQKGWSKLGARLRRNRDGRLEYHLPAQFTEDRPAFLFSTSKHAIPITQHPVLSKLPKATPGRPTVFKEATNEFRYHVRAPTDPEQFEDWLYQDIPQIAFHITSFTDVTVINCVVLHTLTDFLGVGLLFRAWLSALHGDVENIPPFIGTYKGNDPLDGLLVANPQPPSKYVHFRGQMSWWGFYKFAFWMTFDRWWWPKASMRFVCLPGVLVDKLVSTARQDLEEAKSKGQPVAEAFISDGDVLSAWLTRLFVKFHNPRPNRLVQIVNRFDSRDLLVKMDLLPESPCAFMGNAAYSAICFASARDVTSSSYPLGLLAARIRNSIKIHREIDQVAAQDAAYRDSVAKTGHLPMYGDSGAFLNVISNAVRGKLFDMDFSPALMSSSGDHEATDKSRLGRPEFINVTGLESRFATRNNTGVLGKTKDNDYWLSIRLRDDVWDKVEEAFRVL